MLLANTKAGQPMEYQLSETVVRLLKEAQAKQCKATQERTSTKSSPSKSEKGRPSLYVLPAERGSVGHFVGLQKVWDRIREKARLPDVRIHDLRHSYASMAIESGAEIVQVKELLGHRNIATTQRYVHLYADTVRESVAKVEAGIFEAIEVVQG
jgi:site-specific recombinase XerD